MTLLRPLLLPAVVATPLWLWLWPVPFRGIEALAEFPAHPGSLIIGTIFTLIGLLGFGLPVAAFVSRQPWPVAVRAAVLLLAGAAGGCLVAIVFVLLFMLASHMNAESIAGVPIFALNGLIPGAVVAVVWMAINFNQLRLRT